MCHAVNPKNSSEAARNFGVLDVGATAVLNMFPELGRVLGGNETEKAASPDAIYQSTVATSVALGQRFDTVHDAGANGGFRLDATAVDLPRVNNVSVPSSPGASRPRCALRCIGNVCPAREADPQRIASSRLAASAASEEVAARTLCGVAQVVRLPVLGEVCAAEGTLAAALTATSHPRLPFAHCR